MAPDDNDFPNRGVMILLPHVGVGVSAIPLLLATIIHESGLPVIVHHSNDIFQFPSSPEPVSESLIEKIQNLPLLLNNSANTAHLKKENINRAAQFIEINKRKGGRIKGKHRRNKK